MNEERVENLSVSGLCQDSRRVKPGDLFIAVHGTEVDGRDFISKAIEQGAVAVLSEGRTVGMDRCVYPSTSSSHQKTNSTVPIIPYSDLKNALGFIAARFYDQPSARMKVIGITGTNGKTSISHFIAQLCNMLGKKCGIVGTLGSGFLNHLNAFGLTTPDPILLQATFEQLHQQGAEFTAMEVTSHALDQGRVAGTQFQTAIFTNLTRDHLDYHETLEDYFKAKQKLFTEYKPRNVILNLDDAYGQTIAKQLIGGGEGVGGKGVRPRNDRRRFTNDFVAGSDPFSTADPLSIIGITTEPEIPDYFKNFARQDILLQFITTHALKMTEQGSTARIQTPWGEAEIVCPLLGQFNLSNVLAAVAALCLEDDFSFKEILSLVPSLKPVAGRMNNLGGTANDPSIIIDYAHTPDALSKVLTALRSHCRGKLILVFGCGGDRDPGKRAEMAQVAEKFCDQIIVTQDNPRTENPNQIIADILKGFSGDGQQQKMVTVEPDRALAIQLAVEQALSNDMIIIAGKGHEMVQIIGTEQIPFSDEQHAKSALERRQVCQY